MGEFIGQALVKRYWKFAASGAVHILAFAVIYPQIDFRREMAQPILVELVFDVPEPPPALPPPPNRPEVAEEVPPLLPVEPLENSQPASTKPKPESVSPIIAQQPIHTHRPPPLQSAAPRGDQTSPPVGSNGVRAVHSILCLRMKGAEREQYGCDESREPASSYVEVLPNSEEARILDQHVDQLSLTNRRESYLEKMMDRNYQIPATMPGVDDNTVFQESGGRDQNAVRIRNGERPYWENDLRKDLENE